MNPGGLAPSAALLLLRGAGREVETKPRECLVMGGRQAGPRMLKVTPSCPALVLMADEEIPEGLTQKGAGNRVHRKPK